ncbi:DNA mismatch repair protein MutL [Anaerosporomusa subterranea]|uniref:DNA mismatch repair protein MutL n=1 Tax=Anaerosporomusa subterranea TaxID=1794912 RepID=A0A154BT11_ANASB|nr:DNA mismatch repair endonuclease MutL [Anaerosporomusa subterranea]KYZ77143.1 DNA mismatch repair protein MutL [Anaerosporomusa subterranea]
MSATIRILDETVANQIAAGEVVERPASIIKELVENALDAGARSIAIEIADGGISFIRVTDDGSGMSETDARLAVIRHATSKITSADDLSRIATLGFRGEALPSIAAVSKFTLITRLPEANLGTRLEIHGGSLLEVSETGADSGTSITIVDLFYNTPARRKFLKAAAAEASQIHLAVVRLALSRSEIAFRLINNGKLVLSTPGGGSIEEVMGCVYGHQIVPELLPLPDAFGEVRVSGCIGKPSILKSSRQWQTFIVNGRVISNRMLSKALDNAFHSLLPHSGFPLAVVTINLSPADVDVNIHPQKSEVKFRDERSIYGAVYRSVSDALTQARQPQSIAAPYLLEKHMTEAPRNADLSPSVTTHQPALFVPDRLNAPVLPLSVVRESLAAVDSLAGSANVFHSSETTEQDTGMYLQALGQVENCYIVARGTDGLYIVDQHAAHERILYDKMQQASGRVHVQKLLIPILLTIDPLEGRAIAEAEPALQELGFTLEPFGPDTYRLTEVPADVNTGEAEALLKDALRLIGELRDLSPAALRHAYLQTAACKAAVKAGDLLNIRQLQAILDELCLTDRPFACPHGRPAMVRFGGDELGKMFKRT